MSWSETECRLVHEAIEVWGSCRGAIWEQYFLVLGDRPAGLVIAALRSLAQRKTLRPAPAEIMNELRRTGKPPEKWKCRHCRGREAVYVRVWKAQTPELSGLLIPPGAAREIPSSPGEGEVLLRPDVCRPGGLGIAARPFRVPLYCGRCSFRLGVMSVDEWIEKYEGFFEPESAADAEILAERARGLETLSGEEVGGRV